MYVCHEHLLWVFKSEKTKDSFVLVKVLEIGVTKDGRYVLYDRYFFSPLRVPNVTVTDRTRDPVDFKLRPGIRPDEEVQVLDIVFSIQDITPTTRFIGPLFLSV